jgi:hypothetical protein
VGFLRQAGLRYHGRAIAPGAQTQRRGDAGPVLLGGGHAPAAVLLLALVCYPSDLTTANKRLTLAWSSPQPRGPKPVTAWGGRRRVPQEAFATL